jgi:hypothetical protein
MALMMNDHADDKPKLYYGVRRCKSLEGPAIFLNWADCKFFVGSEKDDNIEFQSFERIVDAASYVTFQQETAANDIHPITPPTRLLVAAYIDETIRGPGVSAFSTGCWG